MSRELNSVEKEELRVKTRENKSFVFIFRFLILLLVLLFVIDYDEEKYESWDEAYSEGVFDGLRLPVEVPESAFDVMLSLDEDKGLYWGKFYINSREEVESLLSGYARIDRGDFKNMGFPHPGGFPWGGKGSSLVNLESYSGRTDKVEYYSGSCANENGLVVVVFNGYSKSVYYGCELENLKAN